MARNATAPAAPAEARPAAKSRKSWQPRLYATVGLGLFLFIVSLLKAPWATPFVGFGELLLLAALWFQKLARWARKHPARALSCTALLVVAAFLTGSVTEPGEILFRWLCFVGLTAAVAAAPSASAAKPGWNPRYWLLWLRLTILNPTVLTVSAAVLAVLATTDAAVTQTSQDVAQASVAGSAGWVLQGLLDLTHVSRLLEMVGLDPGAGAGS